MLAWFMRWRDSKRKCESRRLVPLLSFFGGKPTGRMTTIKCQRIGLHVEHYWEDSNDGVRMWSDADAIPQ